LTDRLPVEAEQIKGIAVIGAGIMGQGIAQSYSQARLNVHLVDRETEILENCLAGIKSSLRLFEEFGLLKEEPQVIKSRIKPFTSSELNKALDDCQFVVEAVPEIIELKRELFGQIDSSRPDIILSSNTSSFTVSALAEGLKRPERVIGLHYFNPANIIPLVEIHNSEQTDESVIKTTIELMKKVGKKPVHVKKELPGFLVNRIQVAMAREIEYLLGEGVVSAEDMDTAAKASYGFRLACLGPLETNDMQGLDTLARAGGNLIKTLCNRTEPSEALLDKVSKGEFGIKSGKGWHDYTNKSIEEMTAQRTRKLLRQLVLFQENE